MNRPTLPRYRLAEPTARDAIRALSDVLGDRRGRMVWDGACDACGLDRRDGDELTFPELRRIAGYLAEQPTAVGPLGVALRTRLAAYESLLARVSGVHLSRDA